MKKLFTIVLTLLLSYVSFGLSAERYPSNFNENFLEKAVEPFRQSEESSWKPASHNDATVEALHKIVQGNKSDKRHEGSSFSRNVRPISSQRGSDKNKGQTSQELSTDWNPFSNTIQIEIPKSKRNSKNP